MTPKTGYRYLSLYTTGNDWVGTKAGVNTEGLVIITASAPGYLDKKAHFQGRTNTATLLSRYSSVDKALKALESNEWSCGPEFIIMADKKEIASIEFGMNGRYSLLSRESKGVLFHTNHYISTALSDLNPTTINASSAKRYDRISGLLESRYTLDINDAKTFSKDPTLWRTGT